MKSKTQIVQSTRRKELLKFCQITIITKQTMDILWNWFCDKILSRFGMRSLIIIIIVFKMDIVIMLMYSAND